MLERDVPFIAITLMRVSQLRCRAHRNCDEGGAEGERKNLSREILFTYQTFDGRASCCVHCCVYDVLSTVYVIFRTWCFLYYKGYVHVSPFLLRFTRFISFQSSADCLCWFCLHMQRSSVQKHFGSFLLSCSVCVLYI